MPASTLYELKERFHDPHALLGLHSTDSEEKVIRLWRPEAELIRIELLGQIVTMERMDAEGLFTYKVPASTGHLDYRVFHQNGLLAYDPYAFWPTFGEMDAYLFNKGVHYQLYEALGARLCIHQGVEGVKFAVWAPSASSVALVGDFNFWDARVNPMRSMGQSGVWELFVPGLKSGEKYKFAIRTREGSICMKADPFALYSEVRPKTASVVSELNHAWKDADWMEKRRKRSFAMEPLNIYEVHLGSWKGRGETVNYRDLAHTLAQYCQEMGFTHVELLPITEHPLDESWGYQTTGYFAATSRFGTPEDFQYFVDHFHQMGIGVILDWVASHFPTDEYAIGYFDGTALYEHADPRKGFHPHWNTAIFNYGRSEVSNFLLASALFWLEKMHIDGLRVDAVASMLYLDYGREEGEWIPNPYGGKENLEAIEFLKHLNAVVHERVPSALMIAEESTSFPQVTHPLAWGGLGFDLKWNLGWMNDTLRYFHVDPIFRHHHHNDLTFGMLYAFSEKFLLVLSHDEVVHGKGSLLSKMPGDDWQKFANMRLLYSYMICQVGKKLLFMGGEIGQWREWHCKEELHWSLLQYPKHLALQRMVKEINHLYLERKELWECDAEPRGFAWVDFADQVNSVICYLRKSASSMLFCVHNFTPKYFPEYYIRLHRVSHLREIFNSDREEYGGSGKICGKASIEPEGVIISLAPLATQIFEVTFEYQA